MNLDPEHGRTAEALLAATGAGVGVSLAATLQVIQIVAGCVAICSGILAGYFYWRRIKALK